MADYERAGQTLPENATNSEFSKCQVFDLRWTSTGLKRNPKARNFAEKSLDHATSKGFANELMGSEGQQRTFRKPTYFIH